MYMFDYFLTTLYVLNFEFFCYYSIAYLVLCILIFSFQKEANFVKLRESSDLFKYRKIPLWHPLPWQHVSDPLFAHVSQQLHQPPQSTET